MICAKPLLKVVSYHVLFLLLILIWLLKIYLELLLVFSAFKVRVTVKENSDVQVPRPGAWFRQCVTNDTASGPMSLVSQLWAGPTSNQSNSYPETI